MRLLGSINLRLAGVFSAVTCASLVVVSAQTKNDLFEKAFGKSSPQPRQISIPLIIERRTYDELQVVLAADPDAMAVEALPLLNSLRAFLRPDVQALLNARSDQGKLTLKTLRETGLDVIYDEAKLELRVDVPPALRPPSDIRVFGNQRPPEAQDALPPSPFSFHVNLRTGFDHVQQSASGLDEGLQPFRGDLDGALNWNGFVFEGTGGYAENSPYPWQRGDFRVVRDDPDRMLRYSLGDLSYPVSGFQSFQPMAGLTVAKNFALQPYRVTEPRGQTSFFLRTPSRVEVFVNGRQVQMLQLPAGQHNIRDFLFASGGNDVQLRITDEVGRVETIALSFFFDSRLLAQGEQEFSYSVGFPSRPERGGKRYDTDSPTLSLFHRAGISDSLTAGLNFQGNPRQQMLGADTVWATPLGTFHPDLALSRGDELRLGYATRLDYQYFDATSAFGSAWNASVQYRSPWFTPLSEVTYRNEVAWDFSARYSQRLPWEMNGGIGGNYQTGRSGRRNASGVSLFLSKRFGRDWSTDLTFDRRDTFQGRTEHRAFVSLTYLFPSRRQSLRASHDTFSDTSRANYQFSSRDYIGGFDGNLGLQRTADDDSGLGSVRYNGSRAEASVSQDVSTPGEAGQQVDSRTSFRFGTALVYADKQFAISRPVRDSFAIIAAHPAYRDQEIGVDRLRDSYTARIGPLGPAVIPDMTSYQVRNLSVEAPHLPDGFDLGKPVFAMRPTYKSGTVIRVGLEPGVLLTGTLEKNDGSPLSLQAGEFIPSDAKAERVEFFTNRRGRFSVDGLRPGIYDVQLFDQTLATFRIEIPRKKTGTHDLGALTVAAKKEPRKTGDRTLE